MKEPQYRAGTKKAIQTLVAKLNLQHFPYMQDWPYEIGDVAEIDKYIHHYEVMDDDDQKFILMEMIIQATNDQRDAVSFDKYWNITRPLLEDDIIIHEYTVYYWSCFDRKDLKDCWEITPNMRELWNRMAR